MEGFITLDRKIIEWEWYTDPNTMRLFIHLLLQANHKDKKYRGIVIKRGQHKTGRIKLARELKLSEQKIRTSLNKLKSTNEIAINSTNGQYSIITLNNYDKYQSQKAKQPSKQPSKQPNDNQTITINNNVNNENKNKNISNDIYKKKYFDNPEVNESFIEYLQIRNKSKWSNSESVLKRLIKTLNPHTDDIKLKILDMSIVRNYRDLFEPNDNNNTKQKESEKTQKQILEESKKKGW